MSAKQFSIFVKNHRNKNQTIHISSPIEEVSVDHLKRLVQKLFDVSPDQQQLIFSAQQLKDGTMLSDYPGLGPNSTVYLLIRLPGGSEDLVLSSFRPFPKGIPKAKNECMICFSSPSVKMPCGDMFCPPCIIRNTRDAIQRKQTEIKCSICKGHWDLSVIREYGTVNKEEIDKLSKQLSENYITGASGVRECPGCGNFCMQADNTKKRVYCRQCAKENRTAEYCFECSQPWKNPSSYTNCGNAECGMDAKLLRNAPIKTIGKVKCPSYRLCPKCNTGIEHKERCKHMTCPDPSCKTKFCFVCLSVQVGGVWPESCGGFSSPCTPAPTQQTTPAQLSTPAQLPTPVQLPTLPATPSAPAQLPVSDNSRRFTCILI